MIFSCDVVHFRWRTNPEFNASFGGDCIYYHGPVNVGIAIALPEERGGGLSCWHDSKC